MRGKKDETERESGNLRNTKKRSVPGTCTIQETDVVRRHNRRGSIVDK